MQNLLDIQLLFQIQKSLNMSLDNLENMLIKNIMNLVKAEDQEEQEDIE